MVRAANTGPSMVITPTGHVSARTDVLRPDWIVADLEVWSEPTWYALHGDRLGPLCAAVMLLLALVGRRGRRVEALQRFG